MKLKARKQIDVAVGASRTTRKWKNTRMEWADLVERCSHTVWTDETPGEYARMSQNDKSRVKDVGGFVGGFLSAGCRKTGNVLSRSILTIDVDHAEPGMWEEFKKNNPDVACFVYSTHSHTKENERWRVCMLLDRDATPEEYEAVSRWWSARIGIEAVDHTTHQLARLFYWPSTSKGGDFFFDCVDGEPVSVDKTLSRYRNWKDATEWPMSEREGEAVVHEMRKAGDPLSKPGFIGAFCRAYTIEEAIDTFLAEEYERTAREGRYTYSKGHVAGGLVCYEGKWAYSHHETDPAGGKCLNAFDLVRIHKFGVMDEGKHTDEVTKLPSYKAMEGLVEKDARTGKEMMAARTGRAVSDFEGVENEWMDGLDLDKSGAVKSTSGNLRTIMRNDPNFRNVRYDGFSQKEALADGEESPFAGTHAPGEVDDASLAAMCAYLYDRYAVEVSVNTLLDRMLRATAKERSYNPVHEFILKEEWDGVPRIDTLLIDYLGAEDTPLNRAISRKWCCAAVGRAFDLDPDTGEGIKFDSCLLLTGKPGIGKSTFTELLANKWRGSISLDDDYKTQCEALLRGWITEIPELAGMRKADLSKTKDLITRRSDDFRPAYGRTRDKHPRRCVFIGSSNDKYVFTDDTIARRFWSVEVTGGEGPAVWADKLRKAVGQIWAEAHAVYREGESLMLPPDLEAEMKERNMGCRESLGDPLRDFLIEWLDIPLPADWDMMSIDRKRRFYTDYDPLQADGVILRDKVSVGEIICLCPYSGVQRYTPKKIGEILVSLGWESGPQRERYGHEAAKDGRPKKQTVYHRVARQEEEGPI